MMQKKIFLAVALSAFFASVSAFAEAAGDVPAAPIAENSAEKPSLAAPENFAGTQISRVVVFPESARVTRSAQVSLRAGEQEIVLAGLPMKIAEDSLTAETTIPGARITAVVSDVKSSRAATDQGEIEAALKNLKEKEFAVKRMRTRIASLENYVKRIEAFAPRVPAREATGTPYVFSASSALRGLNFSTEELKNALAEMRRLEEQAEAAQLDLEIARSEYSKLNSRRADAARVVRVKIFAGNDASGEIFVHYMAEGASWRPGYDVRVDPATKTVALVSYGVVSQSTGEDWVGVPVTLSTARPNVSADLPEFKKKLISQRFADEPTPIFLRKNLLGGKANAVSERGEFDKGESAGSAADASPRAYASRVPARKSAARARERETQFVIDNAAGNAIVFSDGRRAENVRDVRFQAGNYVFVNADGVLEKAAAEKVVRIARNVVESDRGDMPSARLRDPSRQLRGLDFRYALAQAETIKSTGEAHRYLLASENFSGDFYYRLEPSINENAYQMVEISNPRFRPILAGPANIFYGADFIGDMDFPYTIRDGKVSIPLGVDPRVSVKRSKINDIETVGTFTSSSRNRVRVSVKVNNRTPNAIRVVCAEAVPVSVQKEIVVSDVEFSPNVSEYSKGTGIARWNETISPGAEAELRAAYRIDYPKNFELRFSETSR